MFEAKCQERIDELIAEGKLEFVQREDFMRYCKYKLINWNIYNVKINI